MTAYTVAFTRRAGRQFTKLSKAVQQRIIDQATALEANPLPEGCVKLKGVKKGKPLRWRIRVGNFRVVDTIDDERKLVEIVEVRDRKDVYR
jgi:mRNA interferase RelE/StbE